MLEMPSGVQGQPQVIKQGISLEPVPPNTASASKAASFEDKKDTFKKMKSSNLDVAAVASGGGLLGAIGTDRILNGVHKFVVKKHADSLINATDERKKALQDALSIPTKKEIQEYKEAASKKIKECENLKKKSIALQEEINEFNMSSDMQESLNEFKKLEDILNSADTKIPSDMQEEMKNFKQGIEEFEKHKEEVNKRAEEINKCIEEADKCIEETNRRIIELSEIKIPAKYRVITAVAGAIFLGGIYAMGKMLVKSVSKPDTKN